MEGCGHAGRNAGAEERAGNQHGDRVELGADARNGAPRWLTPEDLGQRSHNKLSDESTASRQTRSSSEDLACLEAVLWPSCLVAAAHFPPGTRAIPVPDLSSGLQKIFSRALRTRELAIPLAPSGVALPKNIYNERVRAIPQELLLNVCSGSPVVVAEISGGSVQAALERVLTTHPLHLDEVSRTCLLLILLLGPVWGRLWRRVRRRLVRRRGGAVGEAAGRGGGRGAGENGDAGGNAEGGEGVGGDVGGREARAGDARAPGDDRAGDDRAGDARAGDDRAGDARAGDDRAGGAPVGETRAGEARAGDRSGLIPPSLRPDVPVEGRAESGRRDDNRRAQTDAGEVPTAKQQGGELVVELAQGSAVPRDEE